MTEPKKSKYIWAATGDVNAFFGLMLDNIAGLVLMVSMLASIYGFPVDFALRYMVPGTAIGVMVGDLLFFWLAFRYAKRTGKTNVTAMPLGLDTPSTIGMVLFVLGPAYTAALAKLGGNPEAEQLAAMEAWQIGICAIFITGVIKLLMSFGSNWVRSVFPRAGLLGSLAAIALVLIAFTQLPKIAINPVVGFASMVIILVTLVGRGKLPFRIPGALGAVMVGCLLWYLMVASDTYWNTSLVAGVASESFTEAWLPTEWMQAFQFGWFAAMGQTVARSIPVMAGLDSGCLATLLAHHPTFYGHGTSNRAKPAPTALAMTIWNFQRPAARLICRADVLPQRQRCALLPKARCVGHTAHPRLRRPCQRDM